MKKLLLLLTLFCTFASEAQKTSAKDNRFDGLDATFEKVLKDWNAAGFAVVVVEKNKIVYSKGFGFRDVEKKLPVTPNTLFAIGSCTKAFTASLMGLLQKEGKVDLDKPARTYLPSLQFYNNEMNNGVTVRDMMSHRTGLPRHDYSWYLFTTSSRDSIIQRIQYQQPTFALRDKWQYNNFMFLAQGSIAEKTTSKSWEQNIKEAFFAPLEMKRSNFSVVDLQKDADASLGYGLKKDSIIKKLPYYNIDAMGPAGSINSSVTELSRWVMTWINGGKWGTKEIIPAAYLTEAISTQAIIGAGLPSKEKPDVYFSTYGFGWFLSSYRGHYRVEHGGNIDGFSANVSFFPTDSIGIIVLSNQNGSRVPTIVRNMISDRMLKVTPYSWNADFLKDAKKAKEAAAEAKKTVVAMARFSTPTHSLKEYEGTFAQPGYGKITIVAKDDSLFAKMGEKVLWLKHDNYDVFDFFEMVNGEELDTASTGPIRMQFLLSKKGDVDRIAIDLEAALEPLVFTRQLQAKPISVAELEKYVGDYSLSGIDIKVSIKNKTLYMLVPGQPEYELVPTEKNKFGLKTLNGYSVLFGIEDGKVTSVTLMQPNGNFKAVKK